VPPPHPLPVARLLPSLRFVPFTTKVGPCGHHRARTPAGCHDNIIELDCATQRAHAHDFHASDVGSRMIRMERTLQEGKRGYRTLPGRVWGFLLLLLWGGRHQFRALLACQWVGGASPSAQPGVSQSQPIDITIRTGEAPESSHRSRRATIAFPSAKSESSRAIVNAMPTTDGQFAMACPQYPAQTTVRRVTRWRCRGCVSHSNGSASLHVKDPHEGGCLHPPIPSYSLFVDTFLCFYCARFVSIDDPSSVTRFGRNIVARPSGLGTTSVLLA